MEQPIVTFTLNEVLGIISAMFIALGGLWAMWRFFDARLTRRVDEINARMDLLSIGS